MQAELASKLKRVLSSERLAAYRQRTQGNDDLNLFCHYVWNIALSESLYPSLQALEVILRNTIHHAACGSFAELNFGFLTSLLDRRYEQVLWPAIIREAFPYMPRRYRTRINLLRRFNEVRRLRNRVFHHEPIWYWPLPDKHQRLLEAIHWIEPTMGELIAAVDRFPHVYTKGTAAIETKLRAIC